MDIESQNVRLHDLDVAVLGDDFAQRRDEATIELHGDQAPAPPRHSYSERARAGANLEHLVVS